MFENCRNIESLHFGVLSPDEIEKMAVVKLFNNKLSGPNSVYDKHMGPIDNNILCPSCGLDNKGCPGHFGYISLNYEIIHPLFYKQVVKFLKCFCKKCSKCLITQDQIDFINNKGKLSFKKICDKIEKIEICPICNFPQPKISYSVNDNLLYMIHKNKKEQLKVQLTEFEIKNIFQNIPDVDIEMLGLNPLKIHPKNLILKNIPVLPPIARPYVVAENLTCDDDLTIQYLEIVKINNHLKDNNLNEIKKQKYIQSLRFRIKCLYDNSHEKAKHTNGRPMKGIKKRIAGKEGQIRNNLMGKRVNKSARTVIGPDPTLCLDEIAVPPKIAKILTYPVKVNANNYFELTDIVNNNKANFVIRHETKNRINLKYALFRKGTELMYNDKIIRKNKEGENIEIIIDSYSNEKLLKGDRLFRNEKEVDDLKYLQQKNFKLQYGDIVERHLQDNDIVLLNRQPTLHKGSMLAQRIKIIPGKTIRMNLAITKTFNADFDGDEMNIHAPSNQESETELRFLSCSKYNMISAQSSKPSIAIVQDSLLGAFLMTRGYDEIPLSNFYQISSKGKDFSPDFILQKIEKIRQIFAEKNIKESPLCGKGLFSLLLPDDFIYENKNKADDTEDTVKIYKGVLYSGVINKKNLGSGHSSITNLFHKEYDEEAAISFVNNVQFLANEWLLYHGFSIGISDCIATKTREIQSVISRCFIEAKGVEDTTNHPKIREAKINGALSKARDNGMKLAKEALDKKNGFISTVTAGSKGDYFNIAQITGLLGQQNFSGGRIKPTLNQSTRTLPHYPFKIESKEQEYESKGFISNSFIHGLNPKEFWFHALTGREGLTDTAMKTAQSGYIQRRMVKLGEDVQIKYDHTVRNAKGDIIQFSYGDDGLDGVQTSIIDNLPQICNISRMANKLNLHYEMEN